MERFRIILYQNKYKLHTRTGVCNQNISKHDCKAQTMSHAKNEKDLFMSRGFWDFKGFYIFRNRI